MNNSIEKFALCIDAAGSEDLEKGKVYQILQDPSAEAEDFLRVINESTEDCLYPSACFVFIELPQKARDALTVRI
jgi:hypothetical protein